MQDRPRIETVRTLALPVTGKTTWCLVELGDSNGARGWGEATLFGHERAIEHEVQRLAPLVTGTGIDADIAAPGEGLVTRHVRSALDQARLDLLGQWRDQPLYELLGGAQRDAVCYYANINRGTLDRTPQGWATRASAAVAAGFDAVKMAPFDGVDWHRGDCAVQTCTALDCIRAVRQCLGPGPKLLIDCHGRFTRDAALDLLEALQGLEVFWLEDPLPAPAECPQALAHVRRSANAVGIQVAGGEDLATAADCARLIEAGCFDVLVPDIRALGGFHDALAAAALAAEQGVRFAPHNPAGPILDAASYHLALAVPELLLLEVQFEETPLFDTLVEGALERRQGKLRRRHGVCGLGLAPRPTALP